MLIKNNFKIGQKLRVVKTDKYLINHMPHEVGDIVIVDRVGSDDTFYDNCLGRCWFWTEYTDLELVEDKAGFKIGQKVRVIKDVNHFHDDGEIVTVAFFGMNNTRFYDTCRPAHYFNSSIDELEIVEESIPAPEFKVGDRVRAKATAKEGERYNGLVFGTYFLEGDTTIQLVCDNYVCLKNGFYIGKDAIEVIPSKELPLTFSSFSGGTHSTYLDAAKPFTKNNLDGFARQLNSQLFAGFGKLQYDKPKRKEKSTMQKLTTLAKKLLDPDTKALMEVSWLDSELDLTEDGKTAILVWLLEQNKAALAKEAKDLLAEEKKAKKGE